MWRNGLVLEMAACRFEKVCWTQDAITLYKRCKDLLAAEPSSSSGIYTIHSALINNNAPLEVYCDMATDGGGYTIYPPRDDGDMSPDEGTQPGIATNRAAEPNSCSAIGLQPTIWRSREHIRSLERRYHANNFQTCGGIIGSERGRSFWPSDLNNAMNSDSSSAVTDAWSALDEGDWFIQATPTGASGAPHGNYEPGKLANGLFVHS